MSLDENIVSVVQAIGAEIKEVRADMALISGGALTSTAVLDFGTSGSKYKLFTVLDVNIVAGKKVGGITYTPTDTIVSTLIKESIDDDEFDSIDFSVRDVSVGSFQVLAKSNGIINNYKTIQYTIQ